MYPIKAFVIKVTIIPQYYVSLRLPAGAVHVSNSSDIGIDGDARFRNNSAGGNGGKTGRPSCITLRRGARDCYLIFWIVLC